MDRTTNSAIRFPRWVPQPARNTITELCASSLATSDVIENLLKRLATYPAMRSEVWGKLPADPKGFEGNIIGWAFFAYTFFTMAPRPYPTTKAAVRGYAKLQQHGLHLTDPAFVSQMAYLLWENTLATKSEADFYWARFWEGDPTINPDKVVSILHQLGAFYARMSEEYQKLFATFPPFRRLNAKAHQIFFTDFLSSRMKGTYGRPLDGIVAALTGVAFDLPGVGPETVRGRRRVGKRPEKSKRKTR